MPTNLPPPTSVDEPPVIPPDAIPVKPANLRGLGRAPARRDCPPGTFPVSNARISDLDPYAAGGPDPDGQAQQFMAEQLGHSVQIFVNNDAVDGGRLYAAGGVDLAHHVVDALYIRTPYGGWLRERSSGVCEKNEFGPPSPITSAGGAASSNGQLGATA